MRGRLLAALVGAAMITSVATDAAANGGTPRLARARAGPYLVSVWTQPEPPRVGRLDVAVAIMDPTGRPVLDAGARLRATSPTGAQTVSQRLELGGGGNLLLYHGEPDLPTAGVWQVTLSVEGPAGAGEVAFALDVAAASPWWRAPLIALLIGGVPLAWLLARIGRRVLSSRSG